MNLELPSGFRLTDFRRTDQDALVEYLAEKEIYDRTLRIPHPYTVADAEKWFAYVEASEQQHGHSLNWAIRDDAEKLIGGIGLEPAPEEQTHRVEIGYWLAKPFWGRGITTAAVRAVCHHAFENLQLTRITANVFATNSASARVLVKCGFEREGYLCKHYLKDGVFLDCKVYALVK
jgi:RimJ/RimL family protein N-acetyltransferase